VMFYPGSTSLGTLGGGGESTSADGG
jgi:hypothetical protein